MLHLLNLHFSVVVQLQFRQFAHGAEIGLEGIDGVCDHGGAEADDYQERLGRCISAAAEEGIGACNHRVFPDF